MVWQKRNQIRLKNYDYSKNGAYFVTICSKNKEVLFGKIVGDGIPDVPLAERDDNGNVYVKLSDVGLTVQQTIEYINEHNENTEIEKYVIMPNHIHLLIMVNRINDKGFGTSGKPSPTENEDETRANEIIPKLVSSLKRYTNRQAKTDLWQRSYYDHIIRTQKDYDEIWEYIDTNPIKWELDKYYME
ncbi:MAG: transposase [Ruminococcus sp.]